MNDRSEPLGQSIASVDPEPPNEPSTYEQHLFFASDAEWQCEAVGLGAYGRDLMAIPDHCQNRVLMSFDRGLDQIFGWRPSSLKRLERQVDSPADYYRGAHGNLGLAQRTIAKGLTISYKFALDISNEGKDQNCEDSGDVIRVCTKEKGKAKGLTDSSIPKDVAQRLDPANAGDPNPGDNMQAFDEAVQAVRNILQEKGDNSCAKFFGRVGEDALNKIVAMVSESNFVPLSDSVTGIKMVVDPVAGADFNMPSNGYTTIGPTAVFINSRGPFVDGRAKRIGHQYSATLKSRALQILHEIGHLVVTGVTRGEVKIEVGGEMRTYKVSNLTFLLAPDGPGSEYGLSVANTDKVEKACGEQINALDRKKS